MLKAKKGAERKKSRRNEKPGKYTKRLDFATRYESLIRSADSN
jgi:hypothetical protein